MEYKIKGRSFYRYSLNNCLQLQEIPRFLRVHLDLIVLFLLSIYNNYLTQMSSSELSDKEQDELQLPRRLHAFNQKKQPFRFIQDLNIKLQQVQNRSDSERLLILSLKNCSKSEIILQKSIPALSKFRSCNQKMFQIQEQNNNTEDPKITISLLKQKERKKITIQKKQINEDLLQGKGVIRMSDGAVIFGTWLNGELEGETKIVYPNGDIYSGEVKDHLKHGKGNYKFENGNEYEGDFQRGHFTGYGVLYDQFGQVLYRGIWSNGRLIQNII